MAQLARKVVARNHAQQEVAAQYVPYIRRIAYRLARRLPSHVSVDDLISAGCEGLLDALDKFDPTRVERFEQYAEYRVRGAMLDALRTLDPLGRDTRSRSNRLAGTIRDLTQKLGRAPEEKEIAQAMGCTVESYRRLLEDLSRSSVLSLDDLADQGAATPADEHSEDPCAMAERAELRSQLGRALALLPERHRTVLSLYYVEDLKLREIGQVMGVTESRVCQMHTEAVHRMRAALAEVESAL